MTRASAALRGIDAEAMAPSDLAPTDEPEPERRRGRPRREPAEVDPRDHLAELPEHLRHPLHPPGRRS